jgi:aromatic-L-amino-acid decarboxylase
MFFDRIMGRRDIMMTQTDIDGIFCIRFVVGAERSTEAHIDRAFEIICEEGDATIEAWKPGDVPLMN